MMRGGIPALLLLGLLGSAASFATPSTVRSTRHLPSTTQRYLFNLGTSSGGAAKIPTSTNDRDNAAIAAVKAAVAKPRTPSCPLIECEFPALTALNKLGDGSLRSSLEAEDANVAFANKMVGGISTPFLGPSVSLVMSSSASNALIGKVQKKVKGATLYSLKEGKPEVGNDNVCIFLTPSSKGDYQAARTLAESGCPTIIVNGSFKDQRSVPGTATMAYFVKPLTYNSQLAGYLVRSYPSKWTVLDAQTKSVLGSFSDDQILGGEDEHAGSERVGEVGTEIIRREGNPGEGKDVNAQVLRRWSHEKVGYLTVVSGLESFGQKESKVVTLSPIWYFDRRDLTT